MSKHIREVEFEHALKLYQDALKLHYQGDRVLAEAAYDSLLNSDVLQEVLARGFTEQPTLDRNVSVNGMSHRSSVNVLPYLIFKNHGNLLLENLLAANGRLDAAEVINTLRQVLMEYATGLSFDHNDQVLWQHSAKIASVLNLPRIERYALEVQIADSGEKDFEETPSLFWDIDYSHQNQALKTSLTQVLRTLSDRHTIRKYALDADIQSQNWPDDSYLSWLPRTITAHDRPSSEDAVVQTLSIVPAACNWYAVARAIVEKLRINHHSQAQAPVHFSIDLPDWSKVIERANEDDDSESVAELVSSTEEVTKAPDSHGAGTPRSDADNGTPTHNFDSVKLGRISPLEGLDLEHYHASHINGTHISVFEEVTSSRQHDASDSEIYQANHDAEDEPMSDADSSQTSDALRSRISSTRDSDMESTSNSEIEDDPVPVERNDSFNEVDNEPERLEEGTIDSQFKDESNPEASELYEEEEEGKDDEDDEEEEEQEEEEEEVAEEDDDEEEEGEAYAVHSVPGQNIREDYEQMNQASRSSSPTMSVSSSTKFDRGVQHEVIGEQGNMISDTFDTAYDRNIGIPEKDLLKSRSRKRNSLSDVEDEASTRASKRVRQKEFQTNEPQANQFHKSLRQLFAEPFGLDLEALLLLEPEALDSQIVPAGLSCIHHDLRLLFYKDWNDEKAESARNATNNSNIKSSIAKTMVLEYPVLKYPRKDPECDPRDLSEFAARVDGDRSYLHCVVEELLVTLFSSASFTASPYLRSTWSLNFRAIVIKLIDIEEELLLNNANLTLLRPKDTKQILAAIDWCQAIFELFLDEFIIQEKERIVNMANTQYNTHNENRVRRWRLQVHRLLTSLRPCNDTQATNLRFTWASVVLDQVTGSPVEEVLQFYLELRDELTILDGFENIHIPNCQCMQWISTQALDLEISKFSTMDFFNAVFENDAAKEYMAVLESLKPVLFNSNHFTSSRSNARTQEYISQSPLEFQLLLWNLLSEAAKAESDSITACWAQLQSMGLTLAKFQEEDHRNAPLSTRQTEILSALESLSGLLKDSFQQLEKHPDLIIDWPLDRCIRGLQILFDFLSLLQVFVYYEDAVAEDETRARGTFRFIRFRDHRRQDLLRCWLTIYELYKQSISLSEMSTEDTGQNLAMLINLMHDELGTRECCHLLDGILLAKFEREIFALDRAGMETDLIQVLHCRYGLSFQIGSFIPWEHHTKPGQLSLENSLRMLPFVLSFVQEKSPGVWLPKNDVKIVLEKLEEIAWPHLQAKQAVARNKIILERYLQQDLAQRDLVQSLRGGLDLECPVINRPYNESVKEWTAVSALALVLGRVHLSIYRNRNKNNNKGVADLLDARKFFQHDLQLTPRRAESWTALGFVNSALADNELGHDAEILWKRRDHISRFQREAILCYMMATSLSVQYHRRCEVDLMTTQTAFFDLLFEFGQHLYGIAREPLALKCFERHDTRYHEKGDGKLVLVATPPVSEKSVLLFASRCLYTASKKCTERWRCLMLLGKVHEKLHRQPQASLEAYADALAHAPSQSLGEQGPLLDPHYRLVSSIYKFLVRDKIEPRIAYQYLHHTLYSVNYLKDCQPDNKKSIIRLCEAILKAICNADKKHWHHRPIHRLAVLLQASAPTKDEFETESPLTAAKSRLESLFTAKGSGGNLLSIWKPEFERPGRHYYYANRYTNYYIDLLLLQEDLEGLRNFMRRLRKAGPNVLHHREVWDKLCSNYFSLSIAKACLPRYDSSEIIDVIDSNDFNEVANRLELVCVEETYQPAALKLIRDFHDVRKLNGSLYDSNKIDDELVNCYLSLYHEIKAEVEAAQTKQTVQEGAADASAHSSSLSLTTSDNLITIIPEQIPLPDQVSTTTVTNDANVPPSATKGRGRTKEPRQTKVTRRDILARCFTLCKPRPNSLLTRESGRSRAHSTVQTTNEPSGEVQKDTRREGETVPVVQKNTTAQLPNVEANDVSEVVPLVPQEVVRTLNSDIDDDLATELALRTRDSGEVTEDAPEPATQAIVDKEMQDSGTIDHATLS
ncbi:Histone transcription regulator 3 homolog [Taphrina deformans PYCC 5710]|uniref:Histone transcription regulator 3 homolog n=1 Tax=Taphrina deformans (strain PYCC 5710 / ATCC 11124 / CBS 356.35 / IMI 108563 / JCM 9778 / NBRC 8474) TaxID=1097556 RepID=R4X9Q6_TAPDE|nr:Histone transcription regulator 3 homolog [Taphrina deformans PYCC 5710]|eukprot:CCG80969.1 Histone transcription regulator 3 homolog [Taphrina deformans PYCC 5710]